MNDRKLVRANRLDARFNVIGAMTGRFITQPEPKTEDDRIEEYLLRNPNGPFGRPIITTTRPKPKSKPRRAPSPEPETLEAIVERLKAEPDREHRVPLALRDALIRYPRPVIANNGEEYWIAVENSGATGDGSPPITHSPVRMRPWPMGSYGPWPVGGCGLTGATG